MSNEQTEQLDERIPPVPAAEPTATEDHARALESENADLKARIAALESADHMRELKAQHSDIPEVAVDKLAELVPAESLPGVLDFLSAFVAEVSKGVGTGGLQPGQEPPTRGFAGLLTPRRNTRRGENVTYFGRNPN